MSRGFDSGSLPEHVRKLLPGEAKQVLGKAGATMEEISSIQSIKMERDLHRLIESDLLRRGIFCVHSRMDKKTTTANGVPDFLFAIGGRAIAVEVKIGSNDLSPVQEEVRQQMIANGWNYVIVRTFAEFAQMIRDLIPDQS